MALRLKYGNTEICRTFTNGINMACGCAAPDAPQMGTPHFKLVPVLVILQERQLLIFF